MSEYLFKIDKEIMICQECPIVKRHRSGTICPLREGAERKHGTCPLVEVPTHGRLIDANKLSFAVAEAQNKVLGKDYDSFMLLSDVLRWIDLADTVVEASK